MSTATVDPIAATHANFQELYIEAEDGVELRVFHWEPKEPASDDPFVFVAGWVSIVAGWADFLRAMSKKRPVFYVETREKTSALIRQRRLRSTDFDMHRLARDLMNICARLPVETARTVIAGRSFGATAILEALKHGALKVRGAFLIGPNSEFKAPPVLGKVVYLPAFLYHGFKYILLWYLRTFRVDVKKEPEQMARYDQTLRTANPRRLQLSAISALKYSVWKDLETIEVPVGMAYASSDKLHGVANIERMVEAIPQASEFSCESNIYMHSAGLMNDVEAFIDSLSGD